MAGFRGATADRRAELLREATTVADPDPETAALVTAAARVAGLEPLAAEHRWAAAGLDRARGRLTGDRDAIARALTRWEELGARFERACTLLLLPGREPDGLAELRALRCPPPAGPLRCEEVRA